MFTSYDKALTALILAALYLLNNLLGIHVGIDEGTIAGVITAITPILVWLVPNKAA